MFLQLRAQVAYANGAENIVHHTFDLQGGTIGRDSHCQMVLQDPFRRISRIQAQIVFDEGQFTLINASTSNPIYVDDQELSPGGAIGSVAPLQSEITKRAEKAGSLNDVGSHLELPQNKPIVGGLVSETGHIFVVLEDPPAVFSLIPAINAGKVEWRCEGYPAKYMPMLCRKP